MPLWLVRHAHTDWNGPVRRLQGRTDVGISALGRAEAAALGPQLSRPDRIVTSPARRCLETIAALFGQDAPPPQLDERLWEIDLGRFTGLTEDEVAKRYPDEWRRWQATPGRGRPGGGERLIEMQARVAAAVGALEDAIDDDRSTLVVTHGGPIRVLACFYAGSSLDDHHAMIVENLDRHAVVRCGSGLALDPPVVRMAPATS